MNGRRAAICLVDGNQTMNNESSYDSEVELQHEPNDNAMQMGSVHGALNSAAPWMEPQKSLGPQTREYPSHTGTIGAST